MTSLGYRAWPSTARRLGLALAVSAAAHAAVLSNAAIAPGPGAFSLFAAGPPLSARLAPAQIFPDAPGPLSTRSEPAPPPGHAAAPVTAAEPAAGLPGAEVYFRGSEVDERALPLNEVNLAYPESALAAGLSGVVTLRLKIDHRGVLRDASVVDARPAGVFENAALEAVLGLRFRPAVRNGVAVGSVKTIEVPFYPDCKRTGSCLE